MNLLFAVEACKRETLLWQARCSRIWCQQSEQALAHIAKYSFSKKNVTFGSLPCAEMINICCSREKIMKEKWRNVFERFTINSKKLKLRNMMHFKKFSSTKT